MSNDVRFKNENLLQFRKEKGLSQEELANIIGVSRQAIYKWETEGRMPDINNIIALCEEFNKTLEDFIDGADEYLKLQNRNKKISIKKVLKNIILILLILYIITALVKAIVANMLLFNLEKYKDSDNYSYIILKDNGEENTHIWFKNNIEKIDFYSDSELNSRLESQKWTFTEDGEMFEINKRIYSYSDKVEFEDNSLSSSLMYMDKLEQLEKENTVIDHSYLKINVPSISSKEPSPYKLSRLKLEEVYTISFILNPLNILKIDFENKDIIFEKVLNNEIYKYSKERYITYIDFNTGLLSKEERYIGNELFEEKVYYDYKFNETKDEDVLLTEEMKNEIKEKAKLESEEYDKNYQEELEKYKNMTQNN